MKLPKIKFVKNEEITSEKHFKYSRMWIWMALLSIISAVYHFNWKDDMIVAGIMIGSSGLFYGFSVQEQMQGYVKEIKEQMNDT